MANDKVHRHATAAYPVDAIFDHYWPGLSKCFAKAGLETMHDHVDVFVAPGIEVVNTQQMLEKFLLRTLQMKHVAGMMEDAERVQLVEINLGIVNETLAHVKVIACAPLSLRLGWRF